MSTSKTRPKAVAMKVPTVYGSATVLATHRDIVPGLAVTQMCRKGGVSKTFFQITHLQSGRAIMDAGIRDAENAAAILRRIAPLGVDWTRSMTDILADQKPKNWPAQRAIQGFLDDQAKVAGVERAKE